MTESVASVTFSPLASVSPVFALSLPSRFLKTFESSKVTMMFLPRTSTLDVSHSAKLAPRVVADGIGLKMGSM